MGSKNKKLIILCLLILLFLLSSSAIADDGNPGQSSICEHINIDPINMYVNLAHKKAVITNVFYNVNSLVEYNVINAHTIINRIIYNPADTFNDYLARTSAFCVICGDRNAVYGVDEGVQITPLYSDFIWVNLKYADSRLWERYCSTPQGSIKLKKFPPLSQKDLNITPMRVFHINDYKLVEYKIKKKDSDTEMTYLERSEYVVLYKKEIPVLAACAYYLHLDSDSSGSLGIKPGDDIDGNGVPDLALVFGDDGTCWCQQYFFFELGEKLRVLDFLSGDYYKGRFDDYDHDGNIELVTFDGGIFAPGACTATRARPQVILRCGKDGKFRLAWDIMKKRATSYQELRNEAVKVSSDNRFESELKLFNEMIYLTFSGNYKSAMRLLDLVWKGTEKEKKRFKKYFVEELKKSRFYPELCF